MVADLQRDCSDAPGDLTTGRVVGHASANAWDNRWRMLESCPLLAVLALEPAARHEHLRALADESAALAREAGIARFLAPVKSWGAFNVFGPVAVASVRSTEWIMETPKKGTNVFVIKGTVQVRAKAGGSIFIAGAAVQWLRDQLGLIRTAAESDELQAKLGADLHRGMSSTGHSSPQVCYDPGRMQFHRRLPEL